MSDEARRADRQGQGVRLAIAAAVVIGFGLRAWGLDEQILIDDEFHAFRAGLRADLDAAYLFTNNTLPEDPESDFSSPLALWTRGLAATVGISEWTLRGPMLLATTALVGVVGLLGVRAFGASTGILAAWLAALSPLLITYGRFARPYALVALCGAVALTAAERFRREGSPSSAALLGCAVALGSWFNVSALPGLGLLGLLGFAPALRGRQGEEARRAAALGLALAGGLGLGLLGPSSEALGRFAEMKSGVEAAPASAWWGAAQAAAGSQSPAAVLAFGGLAVWGALWGLRRAPAVTGLALATLVAQLGAFVLLRPYGSDEPLVVARYAIAAYPGLLLLTAAGIAAAVERVPSPAAAAALATALVLGGVVLGPLPEVLGRENAYTSHPATLVGSASEPDSAAVPAFYDTLGDARDGFVVEVPWVLEWPLSIPAHYQSQHGRPVRALTAFWTFRQQGVELRAHVPWQGNVPQLDGAAAVIVHLDLVEEWKRLTGGPPAMPPDRLREAADRYRADARAIDGWLASHPEWETGYEDRELRVYVPAR